LKTGDTQKVLEWIEEKSITRKKADKLSEDELKNKFILGEFTNKKQPVFQGTSLFREGGNRNL